MSNPYTITTDKWHPKYFFKNQRWHPSTWRRPQEEKHEEEHVPRIWAELPRADQWPILHVLRNERAWCMAHGIPAPGMMGIEGEPTLDTHDNFKYRNFKYWWFHLTPAQRWQLWEKRGGSTDWAPPDPEEEKRRFEASQQALKAIKSKNFDHNAKWQNPRASVHFGRGGMHVNV